ncbi:MAG: hypothetical protein IJR91_05180 [Ruminococcus sp.]|nr:hypothetical protein [Ruminococcus sp.]
MELDKRLVKVVPSERQVRFQQLEFYAFIHFTVNTFTDKEWGDGTELPDIFDPAALCGKPAEGCDFFRDILLPA